MNRIKESTVGKLHNQLISFFELGKESIITSASIKKNYIKDVLDWVDLRIMLYNEYGVKIPLKDLRGANSLNLLSGLINHYIKLQSQPIPLGKAS
jgi:acyl carrier protein